MQQPNAGAEAQLLRMRYGADVAGLIDMVVLTDESQVDQRRVELPGVRVEPLRLAAAELDAEDWKALMGLGKPTLYSRMITQIMCQHRGHITLARLLDAVDESAMTVAQQTLAHTRLEFARTYVGDDDDSFTRHLRPGRMIIVDIRDPLAEADEIFALFTNTHFLTSRCCLAAQRPLDLSMAKKRDMSFHLNDSMTC
jgi:DNA phosphorothioation-dependent restriction protein DptH